MHVGELGGVVVETRAGVYHHFRRDVRARERRVALWTETGQVCKGNIPRERERESERERERE